MLQKEYTPKRTVCKVTFKVPAELAEREVSVVGDFNNWDPKADKLKKKNGAWEAVVRFKPETEAKFRYFVDGEKWINDDAADAYVPNEFGTEDSVIKVSN